MVIKRDFYLDRLSASKHDGYVKIVTGVRRCGKSHLLFKLFVRHLLARGDPHEMQIQNRNRLVLPVPRKTDRSNHFFPNHGIVGS